MVAKDSNGTNSPLIGWFGKQDGHVNVNYGYFYDSEERKNLKALVYLTFGKEVVDKYPDIMKRVHSNEKGKEAHFIGQYTSNVAGKFKEAVSRSKRPDGSFDLSEGLRKTNVVESTASHSVFSD